MMTKEIVICLIIIIILTYLILSKMNNYESFVNNYETVDKEIIYNLLPLFGGEYLASIIPQGKEDLGKLIITRSVKSNTWYGPIDNCMPEKNSIIVDLTFDKDKILMCVAMKISKSKYPIYTVYKKESDDIRSKWYPLKTNENIRSITYDDDGFLIGCHADSGQIYKKKTKDLESDWYGPINYDIPMKKVCFDKDGILLGIGLLDHMIYKKMGPDWENESWDKNNRNKERIFDFYHDMDGCIIASSYKGIIKQSHNNYISTFIPYSKAIKRKEMLSFENILKYKTGIDFSTQKRKLNNALNNVLEFKRMALNVCQNKSKNIRKKSSGNLSKINQQKSTIEEIDQLIKQVQARL